MLSKKTKTGILTLPLTMIAMMPLPRGSCFAEEFPVYLRDRGTGIPTSILGVYVRDNELLIYPFYEYYSDSDFEYEPADFGFGSTEELRGRYHAHEALIFFGYGISDRLAVEFEAGVISANLDKSGEDTSALPPELKESGLSDVEVQIRWRWNRETVRTPEFFNFFEVVFPTGDKNSLIGTSDWELALGTGLIKGFSWGTTTFRFAFDYDAAENKFGIGEVAVEYLKRLSDSFRFAAMVEGSEDEISLVPQLQWYFTPNVSLKVNTGFGLTSKAIDFAPEFGIVFSFFP